MQNNKINGRTPEEIRHGLECQDCRNCTYDEHNFKDGESRCHEAADDAIALIDKLLEGKRQLERERDEARNDLDTLNYAVTELHSAYKVMKRERDAAVENLPHLCILCKFQPTDFKEKLHVKCTTCIRQRNWEWIGPQEVN